ncbi:MAG: DsrE family protein [Dehalococcoidia bacterium]
MRTLFVINDPPYGTERPYNALRLAYALAKRDGVDVQVFLIGDGASCAKRGQQTPDGYYNLERMLSGIGRHGGEISVCGSCLDARGLADTDLIEGARRGSLDQLAEWTVAADRVLTF